MVLIYVWNCWLSWKWYCTRISYRWSKRLEYRGYDSAGVAFHEGNKFSTARETGRVKNLAEVVQKKSSFSSLGIIMRWATHGVTESNTHPHTSHDGKFVLVHNGVINFSTLKFLKGKGINCI